MLGFKCLCFGLINLCALFSLSVVVSAPAPTDRLVELAHETYGNSSTDCDFLTQACAPLSDVWGLTVSSKEYVIVGVSNGVGKFTVHFPSLPASPRWWTFALVSITVS